MEFKIIIKKLTNTLSEEDSIIFDKWYNESSTHREYFRRVKENYQKSSGNINLEQGWMALEKKINRRSNQKKYIAYSAVASVAVLVSVAWFFFKGDYENNESIASPPVVDRTIQIGTDKATLTLEDGSNITLEKNQGYRADNASSNGEALVYNSDKEGASNPKEHKIVYNYLTIPRGGEFFLQLADATKVWMNSDSKIKYPVKFVEGQPRRVELVYGEAYFEVSPSKDHKGASFVVKIQDQEVEVLGTEFNIKAYREEEEIATTLVEGSVAISHETTKKYLKPSEQSVFSRANKDFTIGQVDVEDVVSWRKGLFSFKDKSLKDITAVLARWYDVDIVFENPEIEQIKFNGVLRKNQKIENILSIINNTNNIAYEINDKKVILK